MIETFQASDSDFKWLEQCGNGWQFGEQGIIDAIVERLGIRQGTCVEIGAGDGQKLPLTCERLYNAGWRTICYEIDAYSQSLLKFKFPLADVRGEWVLYQRPLHNRDAVDINKMKGWFDLAVIDTDCNDNKILEQIASIKYASVIVCEHFDKACKEEPRMFCVPDRLMGLRLDHGFSIQENSDGLSLTAKQHGYRRIGWTRVNTFFVKDELCTKLT